MRWVAGLGLGLGLALRLHLQVVNGQQQAGGDSGDYIGFAEDEFYADGYSHYDVLMVQTDEEEAHFLASGTIAPRVIGFFPPEESEYAEVFTEFCSIMTATDIVCAMVRDGKLLRGRGYSEGRIFAYPPSRYIEQGLERKRNRYPLKLSAISIETLLSWVARAATPLVGRRGDKSMVRYSLGMQPLVTIYHQAHLLDEIELDLVNGIRKTARAFSGDIVFVVGERENVDVMESLDPSDLPESDPLIILSEGGERYVAKHGQDLETFLADFQAGLLYPVARRSYYGDEL
jgi:hypothetical protein